MDIFKKIIVDQVCYSNSVEDKITDVKNCNSIGDLKEALEKPGLQKTVEKLIYSRIRKIEKSFKEK